MGETPVAAHHSDLMATTGSFPAPVPAYPLGRARRRPDVAGLRLPHVTEVTDLSRKATTMKLSPEPRPSSWRRRAATVALALRKSRRDLRHAARRSGDRATSVRLRRFARRGAAELEALAREGQEAALDSPGEPDSVQVETASEIGAVASCLRSNRSLRIAIERTLESDPPPRVAKRLYRLREQSDKESAMLNERLRSLAVQLVPPQHGDPGSQIQ